jgi:hypothetical protein
VFKALLLVLFLVLPIVRFLRSVVGNINHVDSLSQAQEASFPKSPSQLPFSVPPSSPAPPYKLSFAAPSLSAPLSSSPLPSSSLPSSL